MALVGINQPGYAPQVQGESTFDKILKGLQVATQLGSLGVNIADSFTRSKQAQTDANIAKIKEVENNANIAKSFVPTTENDSSAAFSINQNGKNVYYKLRPEGLDLKTGLSLVENGLGTLHDQSEIDLLKQQGKSPVQLGGSNFYLNLDNEKTKLGYEKARAELSKLGADTEKIKAETKKINKDLLQEAPAVTTKTLTPGQLQVDKDFAKEYNDFITQGGYADVEKNLNQLKEVKQKLKETDSATGPIIGVIPKGIRNIITPEGAAMQDAVEEVVQRNLRLILGAQFTEKEGQRLIERAYSPTLSEQENLKRVNRLIDQIQKAAEAKKAASAYYEEHGTLKGYKGKIIKTIDDIVPIEKTEQKVNKPKTVMQNGHVYHLNEKTGQYE